LEDAIHDNNIDIFPQENASTKQACDNNAPEDEQFSEEKFDKCDQYSHRLKQA
jgi:hypothetical protein